MQWIGCYRNRRYCYPRSWRYRSHCWSSCYGRQVSPFQVAGIGRRGPLLHQCCFWSGISWADNPDCRQLHGYQPLRHSGSPVFWGWGGFKGQEATADLPRRSAWNSYRNPCSHDKRPQTHRKVSLLSQDRHQWSRSSRHHNCQPHPSLWQQRRDCLRFQRSHLLRQVKWHEWGKKITCQSHQQKHRKRRTQWRHWRSRHLHRSQCSRSPEGRVGPKDEETDYLCDGQPSTLDRPWGCQKKWSFYLWQWS